jgi:hypothetical protein
MRTSENFYKRLSEKSSLAPEAVRKEVKIAHREPIFGYCLLTNRWLGHRFTDFSDSFKAKFGKGYRTGSLARIEVFGLLHAVLECKAGEGFFCRVAA